MNNSKTNPVVHLQINQSTNLDTILEDFVSKYNTKSVINIDDEPQSTNFVFSYLPYVKSNNPINFGANLFSDFVFQLIDLSNKRYRVKETMPAIIPTSFIPNKTKSKNNALSRYFIFLDFDDGADINTILNLLSGLNKFVYTTFSHQTKGVNRYRCILPFSKGVEVKLFDAMYKDRLWSWLSSMFTGNNSIDKSCLNTVQCSIIPGINSNINSPQSCNIWYSVDNHNLDLDSLPMVKPKTNINQQVNQQRFDCNDRMVEILKSKFNNNTPARVGGLSRLTMAASCIEAGLSYSQFFEVDMAMRKFDSKTSTETIWNAATKYKDKSPALVYSILSNHEKELVVKPIKKYDSKWNTVITLNDGEYLSHDMLNGERILLCAAMGTGKNTLWQPYNDGIGYKVEEGKLIPILFTALKTIVFQANSDNDIDNKDNISFVYDKAIKLIEKIKNGEILPNQCVLIIDEIHNFKISDYRLGAFHSLYKLITNYKWGKLIIQSATIDADTFDCLDWLKFDKKIKVQRSTKQELVYRNICSDQYELAAISIIRSTCKQKTLVLLNDKDKIDVTVRVLNRMGIKAVSVNRLLIQKKGTFANKLANDKDFEMGNDYDVIVGTTSIVEGININDKVDFAQVIVCGTEPIEALKQLSGRFRKVKSKIDLWHINDFNKPHKIKFKHTVKDNLEIISGLNSMRKINSDTMVDHYKNTFRKEISFALFDGLEYSVSPFMPLIEKHYDEMVKLYSSAPAFQLAIMQYGFTPEKLLPESCYTDTIAKQMIADVKQEIKQEKSIDKQTLLEPFLNALNRFDDTKTTIEIFNTFLAEEYDEPIECLMDKPMVKDLYDVACNVIDRYEKEIWLPMFQKWISSQSTSLNKLEQSIIIARVKVKSKIDYREYVNSMYKSGDRLTQEQCAKLVVDIVKRDVAMLQKCGIEYDIGIKVMRSGIYGTAINIGTIKVSNDYTIEYNGSTASKVLNSMDVMKINSKIVKSKGNVERVLVVE